MIFNVMPVEDGRKVPVKIWTDDIEAEAKQQAKRVREVVKRAVGAVVVGFPGPHVWMEIVIVQSVTIGFLLAPDHDIAEVLR